MLHSENTIMDMVLSETDINTLKSDNLFASLAVYINSLIADHFDELITLLYRLDVNEKKLKDLLQQHAGENTADIIAGLIIERQEQKIKTREQFKTYTNIPEEEKW